MILFLLFFVAPPLLLLIPNLIYIDFLPYLTLISIFVIGFYCVWHGGNGGHDFLPVAATFLFQCLMLLACAFVQIFQRDSFGGDLPIYVAFLVIAIPHIPQLLAVAVTKAIALHVPRKGSKS